MRAGVDLVAYVLRHEVQFLAEVGQAVGEDVQLGGTATGVVGAAPLGGGFEHLVQPGHRAEVPVIASWNSSANSPGRAMARRSFQSAGGATALGLTSDVMAQLPSMAGTLG
jgi:hypothetical protein